MKVTARFFLCIFATLLPGVAFASDPTPLVPFVAFFVFLIAVAFWSVCLSSAKTGLVLCSVHVFFQFLVCIWGADNNIEDIVWPWMFPAIALNIAGIYISVVKISKRGIEQVISLDNHRQVLGYLFVLVGISRMFFETSLFAFSYFSLPTGGLTEVFIIAFGVLLIVSGYSMLSKTRWSFKVCLPVSILVLLEMPLGTMLGAYYLWFMNVYKKWRLTKQ